MNHLKEPPLFLYARIIKKRIKILAIFVSVAVVLTLLASCFMDNIYAAKAIIMPVVAKDQGGGGIAASLMQQVGGLPGITLPESATTSEIVTLLKSTVLREEMIKQHDLLPVLFPDQWDKEAKTWRVNAGFSLKPSIVAAKISSLMTPAGNSQTAKTPGVPDMWDGLRELDKTVSVISNTKDKIITIHAESTDPAVAAEMVTHFLNALNEHMSLEAKRVATTNRQYLEEQLVQTADPYIKQKIYNMIAQQIETSMMAEVKENFAFKVLDRPKVSDKKIRPKRFLMMMVSLVASLLLSVLLIFYMEYFEKIRTQNNE